MTTQLQKLEDDYAVLLRGLSLHCCTLELAGVCDICGTYYDLREEIYEMLQEEKARLAGYYEAQTKERMASLCRDMVRPSASPLGDYIVAMALRVNGQCDSAANL